MPDSSLNSSISQAATDIRTWGAVAVIGAGASFGRGLPLVAQLPPLLWHAFDQDEDARAAYVAKTGYRGDTAKQLIGEDQKKLEAAYQVVENHPQAHHHYQHAFAHLDKERIALPSPVHLSLAELLHRRLIQTVISFNWDTLLEASYRSLYGAPLRADQSWLHKPHGDASQPDLPWILPHQAGQVSTELLAQMEDLRSQHPRVLLVVGYSESDEDVVRLLTGPLASRWKVVRIGPSASGEGAIAATADEALPLLRRALCSSAEVPGWEYVTFNRKQDLASVLSGRRLGPGDVDTCPRLPEVDAVRKQLSTTHAVILSGQSGGGKSITAYQAAHDLTLGFFDQTSWEVVRLVETERPANELLEALQGLPRPALAIVDDAQSVNAHLVRRLLEGTSEKLAALVVTTENGLPSTSLSAALVEISNSRAVAHLAEEFKRRRSETLAAVRQFDDQVGENHLDQRIEWRIEEASKSETPWLFAFALTGGWRRAQSQLAQLRNHDGADLLLAAVAIGQLVSLDAGASRSYLERCASELGRDNLWLDSHIQLLQDRRLIWRDRANIARFRCPHLQFSRRVLEIFFRYSDDAPTPQDRENVCKLLRLALEMEPPLRGVSWLLNALRFTDYFRWEHRKQTETVVPDDLWGSLCGRCWQAATFIERRDALYALSVLLRWHPEHIDALHAQKELLSGWLQEVTSDDAYAWHQLLNDLRRDHLELCHAICSPVTPDPIAEKISEMTWETSSAWSHLISALGACAPKKWFQRLRSDIQDDKLRALVNSLGREQFAHFDRLIEGVAWLGWDLTLDLIEAVLPRIAAAISHDPVTTHHDIRDVIFTYLGYHHHFFRSGQPNARQKRLLQHLARAIDWETFGRAIPERPGDWEDYSVMLDAMLFTLPKSERRKIERTLEKQLDFERLDRLTEGMWSQMPRELEMLLLVIDFGPNKEPARSWVRRHASEIQNVSSKLIHIAPDIALVKIREGAFYSFKAAGSDGIYWRDAVADIVAFHSVDPQATADLIDANHEYIARALVKLLPVLSCEMLPMFLFLVRQMAPHSLNKALALIDLETAQLNWRERLQGKEVERTAVTALLDAVEGTSTVSDELRALATALKAEFGSNLLDYRPEVQGMLINKKAEIELGDVSNEI